MATAEIFRHRNMRSRAGRVARLRTCSLARRTQEEVAHATFQLPLLVDPGGAGRALLEMPRHLEIGLRAQLGVEEKAHEPTHVVAPHRGAAPFRLRKIPFLRA